MPHSSHSITSKRTFISSGKGRSRRSHRASLALVYIERPDAELCFKHAKCFLPYYTWEDVYGFDEDDVARLQEVVESCAHLIMEFSKAGGFDRASGF